MDNSELHFLTYDPEAILRRMHSTYIEEGGYGLYPGDEKSILFQAVLQMFVQAFAGMDNALRMATLRYATGEYLDLIGENRDCARIQAVAAEVTMILVFGSATAAGILPAGTAFTADGKILWMTAEDITLDGGSQQVSAAAICNEAGTIGNALTSGTTMQAVSQIAGLTSAVTDTDATGGRDTENDDDYRERIRIQGLASPTTGSANQYAYIAMSTSTNILDAKAVNGGGGEVDVYLVLADSSTAAADIAAVEAALSAEEVRPLTDNVTVAQATAVNYTLKVKYKPENTAATDAFTEAVEEYQKWQDNTIGRAFNPDKLAAMLYQAGATRVIWDTGSAFNGGTVEYTEIDPDEYCSGTITTAVISG